MRDLGDVQAGDRVVFTVPAFHRGIWPVQSRRYLDAHGITVPTISERWDTERRERNRGLVLVKWDRYSTCEKYEPELLEKVGPDPRIPHGGGDSI